LWRLADPPPAKEPAPMHFDTWVADLTQRGITVLPPSHAVPVELHGVLPDGRGLHFRCRGTTVTLRVLAVADTQVALPVTVGAPTEFPVMPDVLLPLAEGLDQARQRGAIARLVFPNDAAPESAAAIDGKARFGWSGYEAGLLSVDAAAPLFDELLARVGLDRLARPAVHSLRAAA
jgi:hypothetical protein